MKFIFRILFISAASFFVFMTLSTLFFPSLFGAPSVKKLIPGAANTSTDLKLELVGARYFIEYCASCHGQQGRGDGPASLTLSRLPPDFLNPKEKYKNGFTKEGLNKTINNGVENSQMPKFDYLPKEVKDEIVEYLLVVHDRSFHLQ